MKQALEWVIFFIILLVVTEADEMAGRTEGRPGDVEPVGGCQELVGQGVGLQKRNQAVELGGVFGADVGGLTEQVLGVLDTAHQSVDAGVAEAAVDDDGTADGLAGRLQQQAAAIDHVGHLLRRRNVGRVLAPVAELCQREMLG